MPGEYCEYIIQSLAGHQLTIKAAVSLKHNTWLTCMHCSIIITHLGKFFCQVEYFCVIYIVVTWKFQSERKWMICFPWMRFNIELGRLAKVKEGRNTCSHRTWKSTDGIAPSAKNCLEGIKLISHFVFVVRD